MIKETAPLAEPYPLYWPENRPRSKHRENGTMRARFSINRDDILREIRLLGGKDIILSTNVALRRDGLPYAGMAQPDDTGVAVYFRYQNDNVCFACDRWLKVEHNLRAIAMTIEALRGIKRWGTGDMMAAAFKGFTALPAPGNSKSWRDILGYFTDEKVDDFDLRERYLRLRSEYHPDRGGDAEKFQELQNAFERASHELGYHR